MMRPPNCPAEVNAIDLGDTFPDDEPFPLTADEALWLLRGYLVVPASGPVTFAVLDKLPGRIELISGGLRIAR